MNLKNKKILVLGSGGALGEAFLRKLTEKGCFEVLAPRKNECDVLNTQELDYIFRQYKPEIVIDMICFFAGLIKNQEVPYQVMRDNLLGNMNIVEACRKYEVEKLAYVSSQCIFGDKSPIPFKEEDIWNYGIPSATNYSYGIAKRTIHTLLESYNKELGLNAIILIPSNMIAINDNWHPVHTHVVPALIRRFVEAKENNKPEVEIYGTGISTRELLFADDCAEAIFLAVEKYDSIEPVNIGTGKEISIRNLAFLIKRLTGYKGKVVFNNKQELNGQLRRVSDISKAKERFGFEAKTNLDDALKQIINHFLDNRDNLRQVSLYE